jgi:hypothetical protein
MKTFANAIAAAHKYARMSLTHVPRKLLWKVANRQCPRIPEALRDDLMLQGMRDKAIFDAVVGVMRVRAQYGRL